MRTINTWFMNASTIPETTAIAFGKRRGNGKVGECLKHAHTQMCARKEASRTSCDRDTVNVSSSGMAPTGHTMDSLAGRAMSETGLKILLAMGSICHDDVKSRKQEGV